jgi:hypothetical protein
MYKVSYYLASQAVRFKSFDTLTEATAFANKQPLETVIEIKYYDPIDHRKSDRN